MGKTNNQNQPKEMTYKSRWYGIKAKDVDEQEGLVTVAVNGFNIMDAQGDISVPGSFAKTLKEGFSRLKWFLDHDVHKQIGVPIEGRETDTHLVMTGKIAKNTALGHDVLELYKLNAECGHQMEHSIGVTAVKRDEENPAKVLEWRLFEYSTLMGWGANPSTFLVDIKSATDEQVRHAVEYLQQALTKCNLTDKLNKQFDMDLTLMLKALNGGNIVTCPHCGHQFDFDDETLHTFQQQVLDNANMYIGWLRDDIVWERVQEMEPEIRAEVLAIIDAVASKMGGVANITEKALQDFTDFVRCPHCWGKVYRANTLLQDAPGEGGAAEEPSVDTPKEEQPDAVNKGAANGTLPFWESLSDKIS